MVVLDKVLITGSKGFVGKHLCNYLKEDGFQVVTNVSKQKAIDVTNIDQLLKIDNVDAIVHLATNTSITDSIKAPSETYLWKEL